MHHILTLKTDDPLCPVEELKSKELPLYYPLRYGFGGGEVQYSVEKNSSLRIIYICDTEPDDPDDYPFPDQLPEHHGSLRELSYEEARAVAFADLDRCFVPSPEDDQHLQAAGWKDGIRIGGEPLTCQGPVSWSCKNPECQWKGTETMLDALALISDSPVDGVEIFGCSDVEIFFGLCRMCGTVVAVNRCT